MQATASELYEIRVRFMNHRLESYPISVKVFDGHDNLIGESTPKKAYPRAPRASSEEIVHFLERIPALPLKLQVAMGKNSQEVTLPTDGSVVSHDFGNATTFTVEQLLYVPSKRPAVDTGLALLEPITSEEFSATEGVLGVLWNALDHHDLSPVQQAQIIEMARLIESERSDNTPGETKRHRLVGAVGSALRYLAKEAPKDVLAWWKLAEILNSVNWHTIASHLPK